MIHVSCLILPFFLPSSSIPLIWRSIGTGLFVYSFFIDKSCKDDKSPTNASDCLDDEKDIECVCQDNSEYEKRGWFYYLCLIGGPIFAGLGLLSIIFCIKYSLFFQLILEDDKIVINNTNMYE